MKTKLIVDIETKDLDKELVKVIEATTTNRIREITDKVIDERLETIVNNRLGKINSEIDSNGRTTSWGTTKQHNIGAKIDDIIKNTISKQLVETETLSGYINRIIKESLTHMFTKYETELNKAILENIKKQCSEIEKNTTTKLKEIIGEIVVSKIINN